MLFHTVSIGFLTSFFSAILLYLIINYQKKPEKITKLFV